MIGLALTVIVVGTLILAVGAVFDWLDIVEEWDD